MGSSVGRGLQLDLDSRGSILARRLVTSPVYLQCPGEPARQLGTRTQLAWDMASLQDQLAGGRRGREELELGCVLSLHWPDPGPSLQEQGLTVLILHLVGLDMVRERMAARAGLTAWGMEVEEGWQQQEEVRDRCQTRSLEQTGRWQEKEEVREMLGARSGLAVRRLEEARGWQQEEGGKMQDSDSSCSKHWQYHVQDQTFHELEDGLPIAERVEEVNEKKFQMYNILGHPMLWHQLPLTDL